MTFVVTLTINVPGPTNRQDIERILAEFISGRSWIARVIAVEEFRNWARSRGASPLGEREGEETQQAS
jgi:hypothetical protein